MSKGKKLLTIQGEIQIKLKGIVKTSMVTVLNLIFPSGKT